MVGKIDKSRHLNISFVPKLNNRGRPRVAKIHSSPQKTPTEQLRLWIFSKLDIRMREMMDQDIKAFQQLLHPALSGSVLEGLLLIGELDENKFHAGKDFQYLLHRYMYVSQMRLVVSSSLSRYADYESRYSSLWDEEVTKAWIDLTESFVQLTWHREGIAFLIKQLNPSSPFAMMMLQEQDLTRLRYYLGKIAEILC